VLPALWSAIQAAGGVVRGPEDRVEVYGLDRVSMDCLIEIAERVEETRLGLVYRLAGKPFPLDRVFMG